MNITVVRTDKLGDFITALPVCKVLKEYDKNNKIYVCISSANVSLARECDFIDGVILDDGCGVLELSRRFKEAKIDASITLYSNTKVALAQFLAGIKLRIAPATKIAQVFYTKRVRQRRSEVKMAEFEYNLQLAKSLFDDIDITFDKPFLTFNDADEVYTRFCHQFGIKKDVIAFHPGFGGSSEANLTVDEYIDIAKCTLHVKDVQVIMTFGPDEEELFTYCFDMLRDEDVVLYKSQKGLVDFAKIISRFKLFVSTSTGVYHLSALVGTPTITFFGDSLFASASRWKSISDEKIQTHYMIGKNNKASIIKEVKKKLCL